MKKFLCPVVFLELILAMLITPQWAWAADKNMLRGVDFVNPVLGFSVENQNAHLAEIKAAGVHVIRFGVEGDVDKNIDFIRRAHNQNISAVLILHGQYRPGTPVRPYLPKEFPGMFACPPLSDLDPELSRQYFQQVMDKLDANGIVLAGLEFENEINSAGLNGDFSLPGESRNLGLTDLYHDPEGQQIARGFLQYLKVLAVLRQVRDHSQLNRHVPFLPTSLADNGAEGPWQTKKQYDGVSLKAAMAFFRANDVDKLVDAYNIHIYPWADGPGEKASAIHRQRRLQDTMSVCFPANSSQGKPCWITEWGFMNYDKSCPSDEKARSLLVDEMMGDFRQLAQEGTLTGLIYYSWVGEQRFDVFRCGALTGSGHRAISPM